MDLECTLRFDGQRWTPKLEVTCLDNVSFSCHKFPYRLEGGPRHAHAERQRGSTSNLVAFSGSQPVTLKGQFLESRSAVHRLDRDSGPKDSVRRKAVRALLKPKAQRDRALAQPARHVQYSRRPVARRTIRCRGRRCTNGPRSTLNRCSMKYDKFPVSAAQRAGHAVSCTTANGPSTTS